MEIPIKPLERVQTLIQSASAIVQGQNALARTIGYSNSEVANWKSGERPCPPEAQALMAHIAGMDAHAVLAYAMVERHADTARGEKLLSALGKGLAALSVAASMHTSASAAWVSRTVLEPINTMCGKVKRWWLFA